MIRKKNNKGLFEVLSLGRGSLKVPDWVKQSAPGSVLPESQEPAGEAIEPELVEETFCEPELQAEQEVVEEREESNEEIKDEVEEIKDEEKVDEEKVEELDEEESKEEPAVEEEDFENEDVEQEQEEAGFAGPAELSSIESRSADEASAFAAEVAGQLAGEEVLAAETKGFPRPSRVEPSSAMVAEEPMFKTIGDRIRLSVNFVTAGVACLVFVMLLLAAFVIGKKTAPEPGVDSVAANVEQSSGQVVPDLPAQPEVLSIADRPVEARLGKRDAKRFYLVIETLKAATAEDYEDAEEIIEFCRERGLPAEMVKRKGRFAIWCLLGFSSCYSDAALEHARRVEQVGKEFFAKKKTYWFMQRNRKDSQLNPYFIRGTYRKK